MLIDTHAHLFFPNFNPDRDLVIDRAFEAGVKIIINIGDDFKTSQIALRQAQGKLPKDKVKFYSSIGSHPHTVSKLSTPESIHQNMKELEGVYQEEPQKIVAVGECGLDYYFPGNSDFPPTSLSQDKLIELQKILYQAHIGMAKKLNLPLVIHCRDSWHEIFVPELQGTTGVFHSFTGSPEDAKKALDLGYYLGFSCMVTYPKNEALHQFIASTPLNRILTETDSPFLPPQIKRGQRNEPANVIEVIKVIAETKNLSFEEVAKATLENAQRLFRLT